MWEESRITVCNHVADQQVGGTDLSEMDHTVFQTISNEKRPGPSYTK